MTTGLVQDQNLEKQIEKQMGCMAGFLQIFDRHHILTGKRLYSTKRLASSPAIDSASESESPAISKELEKPQHRRSVPSPDRFMQSPLTELRSPAPELTTPTDIQTKLTLPLPVFEFKEGTRSAWKFSKEAPRLSLDSRAVVDAKGSLKPREIRTNSEDINDDNEKQRRSPSVIARLMGLEPLTNSDPETAKKAELRRSASESRVSRDLNQYRFIDGVNFQLKQTQLANVTSNVIRDNVAKEEKITRGVDPKQYFVRSVRAEPAKVLHKGGIGQRKSYFDSADFLPEPKQTVSIYGEIEKRLRMRGIDEPSKDLETLKQILEALQLKGLLHSKKPFSQTNHRNIVCDHTFSQEESPIVLMKPARSPINRSGRIGNDSPPSSFRSRPAFGRSLNLAAETLPNASPRRERPEIERNERSQTRVRGAISPTRSEGNVKSPNRRRPLNVETQRRVSPVQSPKLSPRRTGSDQSTNRSPEIKKPMAEIYRKEEKEFDSAEDELSTISDSISSSSHNTDTERSKVEDYKEGSILERCGKLLQSIAEMTSATELQPSPVSVLDSSFYKEEESPSPVMKRSIEFKDQQVELEDDIWSPSISPVQLKYEDNSDDCDFIYISDILRASNCLPEDSDVFLLLEKQQYLKGKDTSEVSRLQRRSIFDTVNEILNRKRYVLPWKATSWTNSSVGQTSLQQVWSEFQKIRERDTSEDLLEVICGVLRKDLAEDAISGWADCPIEVSEAVLDVERLIFKDLIVETIRELAVFARKLNKVPVPRRKLMF
ncbi:DUF4378 domain-containing protein/VARLMGL domain-containing protein [Cephalotus follicularis]|uniref:DUF4378 domain-containing protein/VARLMGL domain-containing protein n=1 Tax=Cephalotus follicularis TaxID=3775 RepID=A0A1Q3CFW3_CEPFO|nr:DUF4378 domain-containing protein/VARLMGL domain-containing protein [Cephalotus follicularis]